MSKLGRSRHLVVGTGLIVLDVTVTEPVDDRPYPVWTGGTCANVLAILSFLGWRGQAVGRVGNETASACLLRDLLDSGVDTSLIVREEKGGTPIILHQIRRNGRGDLTHGYGFVCPMCGKHYPSFRPITVAKSQEIFSCLDGVDVFYFDRVSRGILDLAIDARKKGLLVVFEPSASTDFSHFVEAYSLSDIVKYAQDRRSKYDAALIAGGKQHEPLMEIETLGADGLRFRIRGDANWHAMQAIPVSIFRDASGAGDWLTAGLLYSLFEQRPEGFSELTLAETERAIQVGQSLAAFNCQFDGPRGAMYASDQKFTSNMLMNLDARIRRSLTAYPKRPSLQMTLAGVCCTCTQGGAKKRGSGAVCYPDSLATD